MKSIFLGDNRITKVYDEEAVALLMEQAKLTPISVTKEEILTCPEYYTDTEYIFSTWGIPQFTEEEIAQYLPSLKAVFHAAGSVQRFARSFLHSGVRVFSAWQTNAIPVAEYTAAQIVLANKGFFLASRRYVSPKARKAEIDYSCAMPGNYHVNVGICGAGMIGRNVIKRLQSYAINILVYDPFLTEEAAAEMHVRKASLEEIFSTCQTVSNHVANLPETVGMYDYELFRLMKDNAVFINTGRGAQVVEEDLIRILEEKPDLTAVLDVTWPEPPVQESRLYTLQNVFLTPHIAGSLGLEFGRMGEYMARQFLKYRKGEVCEGEVSLKMLDTMA